MSEQEAVDLLRKWKAEKRVIHCTTSSDGVTSKILGRIDTIENGRVHLSAAQSNAPLGEAQFVEFPLIGSVCEYSDAGDAPQPLPSVLKGYDALLTVIRQNVSVALVVLPPLDEWKPAGPL